MKRLVLLLPLVAGCMTRQEACIFNATEEKRTVADLIAETERNVSRGYATEDYIVYETRWRDCEGTPPEGKEPEQCSYQEAVTKTRPKAIDLDAEAAKLEQLKEKHASLTVRAQPRIRQCKAAYPE